MAASDRLARIAAQQHGLITRTQLVAAGVPVRTIKSWVATAYLHRVHRGVYLLGHEVMPPLAREMAATLATGGFLSHRSAAALWQLTSPTQPIHVTTTGGHRGNRTGVLVHRTTRIDGCDLTHRHRIPITKPARTLLDLAEIATPRETERAYDEAITRRVVTPRQMTQLLTRSGGRAGIAVITALLDRDGATTLTHPGAEELMLALVREADLPRPEVNVRVAGYEVDFLWRTQRLIVEVDSFAWHGKSSSAFHRDHDKTAHLEDRGFTVKRVTHRQLTHGRLVTAARLARRLAEGSRMAA